jgi:23S rRNA (uracil1939-C5)-methyltransferase
LGDRYDLRLPKDEEKMTQVGETHRLSITDVALPAAFGVGRIGELVTFVPGGVPGDTVRVRVAKVEKRLAYAEILEIEETSPFRERARCPHFGECEGSDLQVLAYEKQLEVKENHLRQVLRRLGGPALAQAVVSPIVPSVDRFFYRSKIEFSFGMTGTETVVGMTERLSPLRPFTGRVLAVDDCCLFSPVAGKILRVVREFVRESGLRAFDRHAGTGKRLTSTGELKRLVLREAKQTGHVLVNVITEPDLTGRLINPAKALTEAVPEVKSVYATAAGRPRLLTGNAYVEERLDDLVLRVYPLSFFQPNPRTAEELCKRIISAAHVRGDERVLGLYCGAGAIELFLARRVKEVTGVDSSAESISCARENAAANGVRNVVFVRDRAERAADRYEGGAIDLVVIDPPRAGLSPEALSAVKKVNAGRLVYVSCNPSTLARDLRALKDEYTPTEITPFDFFPQTAHFEVLAILERR